MPLHLLGKKSWNVYNPENVARVRRDEAQAKAREEEEERRMQEVDAERRTQILRGERPSTPPPPPSPQEDKKSHKEKEGGGHRKRRRIAGEDDTDRDIRLAREDAQLVDGKRAELGRSRTSDAPLEDDAGHINLFPSESGHAPRVEKNAEAETETAEKKRRYEDQFTMRFSNAAGFSQSIGQIPWYSSSEREAMAPEAISEKNVWGKEDPMRKQREMARLDANDPLAAVKKGVRQLKTVEQERKRWNDERRRELEALKAADRERSRRHRRKRSLSVSGDGLEGFKLDSPPDRHRDDKDRERGPRRHHRRYHRDRSLDRSPNRRHSNSHSHSRSHRHHRDRHDSRHDDPRSSRRP